MTDTIYFQLLDRYSSEWDTTVTSCWQSASSIRDSMQSIARQNPNCRVRCVDADGRILDILN